MKTLRFVELLLQSRWEKTARRIPFHEEVTLLVGKGRHGKSCVLETLFRCFGAQPARKDDDWERLETYARLEIVVGGLRFYLFRFQSTVAVFDSDLRLLRTFRSLPHEAGAFWAAQLGFEVGKEEVTPGALLSPYYIAQDSGWEEPLSGFVDAFHRDRGDLVELLMGTREPRYYEISDQLESLKQQRISQRVQERAFLEASRRLKEDFKPLAFTLDVDKFQAEVDELVARCNELSTLEDAYKTQIMELSAEKRLLELQMAVAETSARELEQDLKYAHSRALDLVIACPTCGAKYKNSFRERFAIAADVDDCRALSMDLLEKASAIGQRLSELLAKRQETDALLVSLQLLLQRRHGEIALQDVVNGKVNEEVERLLERETVRYWKELGDIEQGITRYQEYLAQSDASGRRRAALQQYKELLERFFGLLDVPASLAARVLPQDFDLRLTKAVRSGGATGATAPAIVLAHHMAVLHLLSEFSRPVMCPLVVDAPNQKDPDVDRYRKILSLIREQRPKGQQLVMAMANPTDLAFPGTVIPIEGLGLLNQREFRQVAEEMNYAISQLPSIDPLLW